MSRLGDAMGVDVTPARVVLAVVGVAAMVVIGWVTLRPPDAAGPEAGLPFTESPAAPSETASSMVTSVLAHAAGAVAAPGVYELPAGSRVADLVTAAGGATADADLNRVNLAAPVDDGQQVYVPRVGEVVAGSPADAAGDTGTGSSRGLIDINTAAVDQLDELPGIGPAIAQAIVTYREEHGAFATVDELLEVPGIGDAKLAQLRDLVTV